MKPLLKSRYSAAPVRIALAICLAFTPVCLGGDLLEQANTLYNDGKLTEAIKAYKRAAGGGENPALCYFNAANAYYQLDSLPQAVVNYRACVTAAPDYAKGYLNLAVAYFSLNDMASCIAAARRYVALDTANQKGRLILAYAYRAVGDLAGAGLVLEGLARDFPESEEPFVALGEIYRDFEDYDEAEKWFNACPESAKNIDYVYGVLADMREKRGDLAKALFYLQKAYAQGTPKPWTLYKIVMTQQKLGNDLVAYETAREGMEKFPKFPEIALAAGNLAFNRQRLEDAERCYEAARALGSAGAVVGLENVRAMRKQRALAEEAAQLR